MTIDTRLHAQLTAAVDDTTVPPGLAQSALAGGRSRRRRRALGGLAAVTAAVVGGVLLLPDTGPSARDVQPAQGRTSTAAALAWARSLPAGPAPALPFFGEGRLRQSGRNGGVVDRGGELRGQAGVDRHRTAPEDSVVMERMTDRAREACDFTAPALQPSAWAICASLRSS